MRYSFPRWALALPFFLAGSLLIVRPALAAAPEEKVVAGDDKLVKNVGKAIEKGVAFLKSQQRKADGSWELGTAGVARSGNGGWTALAMLALLNAGVKSDDPVFKKGLDYLRKVPAEETYTTGLQTTVLCQLGDRADHKLIRRNVKAILGARMRDGWGYNLRLIKREKNGPAKKDKEIAGIADYSNTQYALLGLHEAIQSGVVKGEPKLLEEIQTLFITTQRNGGWGYRSSAGGTSMTMTAAGLSNLMMIDLDIDRGNVVLLPDGSEKKCGEFDDNKNMMKALEWIGDRFPRQIREDNAVETLGHPFYCLYGIERAGRLTGQRYFGGHDWYEVGCRYLVEIQKADGSWTTNGRTLDHWPVIATSFAVLLLSKGRTPVLISKMAYGDRENMGWNNKRSDVRHLVEFASRELFKNQSLGWQAFDVRALEADTKTKRRKLAADLLQSPIVFLNGHDRAPRDKEAEILREYVANGGFLLAEACCGRKEFDADFRRLMKDLFPGAALKPLDPKHPIWLASKKFAVSPKEFPLWGIEQGGRTVVVYSPGPIAGYWESNNQEKGTRSRKAFELGASIIAYATGMKAPRPRLSRVEIPAKKK
jgi:hypothetical protein